MIERKFVQEKIREFEVHEYISQNMKSVGHSNTKMVKTPLGEKIIIYASRPGLIVGKKGQNIKLLTKTLKKRFNLENPQIEISEVTDLNLDAGIVAERITDSLERFGSEKFKAIGHKVMTDVMNSGALGVELIISGKIPSSRAKSWRFYSGYLKKSGDISLTGVNRAYGQAKLSKGVIGVKVSIMPPTTDLPDKVEIVQELRTDVQEAAQAAPEEPALPKEEGNEPAKDAAKDEPGPEKAEKKRKPRKKAAEEKKTQENEN